MVHAGVVAVELQIERRDAKMLQKRRVVRTRSQRADVEFLQDFPNIRVLLVNTKVPRSTKVLVSKVGQLHSD